MLHEIVKVKLEKSVKILTGRSLNIYTLVPTSFSFFVHAAVVISLPFSLLLLGYLWGLFQNWQLLQSLLLMGFFLLLWGD